MSPADKTFVFVNFSMFGVIMSKSLWNGGFSRVDMEFWSCFMKFLSYNQPMQTWMSLGALFLGAQAIQAQTPIAPVSPKATLPSLGSSSGSQPALPGVARDYRLSSDDVISITVQKHPEFSLENAIVPVSGVVEVPVIGKVTVTGKTLQQLDAEITQRLKVRLLKPEVSVELTKPRPTPIYVVGQVKNPAIYEYKNGWRVTQALAAAGGLSVRADLVYVTVSRGNQKVVDAPLSLILNNPTRAENVALKIGDTVQFYERVLQVNVSGAVNKPNSYSLPIGNGAVEALSLAGGPTEDAALTKATLKRADGTTVPVNLFKAVIEGDRNSNVQLKEGDFLFVPEFKDRISILGAVQKPGFYGIEDGRQTQLGDILAKAGGPTDKAALTKAAVRHSDGSETTVNLYELLIKGNRSADVQLAVGDVVTLPEAKGVTVLGEVTRPGTYQIEEGTEPRIANAIALGGGLSLDLKPETARINVARSLPDGKVISLNIDPVGLLELSDPSQNTRIQDGDVISVSAVKKATIFISGQVNKPGAFELEEGDSVPQLIAKAGGQTDDAALTRVSVARRGGGETQMVDVSKALLTGGKFNFPLQDGDLVVIPRSDQRVYVMPAVNKPGSYAIPEDRPLTVGEAISMAGGPRNFAKLKQVALLRQTPTGVETRIMNIGKVTNDRLAVNEIVQSGDLIYVPEERIGQSSLRDGVALLGTLGSIARIF